MKKNKCYWYDGWFYDIFIDPNQDKLFEKCEYLILTFYIYIRKSFVLCFRL
jgi:hypothetical protein